jgi:hypothetical protein
MPVACDGGAPYRHLYRLVETGDVPLHAKPHDFGAHTRLASV